MAKSTGPKHYVTRAFTASAGVGLLALAWTAVVASEADQNGAESAAISTGAAPITPAPVLSSPTADVPEASATIPAAAPPRLPTAVPPPARVSRGS
jgi:hypothetical protein